MDIKELEPIITLMTQQEERFIKKIDEVHKDVKLINGRLRTVETEVEIIDTELEDIKPTKPVIKHINMFVKHYKIILFLFLITIMGLQILVMEAMEKNWIGELIKFVKP
jgi:hypothetical protein